MCGRGGKGMGSGEVFRACWKKRRSGEGMRCWAGVALCSLLLASCSQFGPARPGGGTVKTGKPYQVFGKTYTPLQTSLGFEEEGMASWYGRKFHNRQTANGEVYNMYAHTAAHKTLPLPSWAEVTNLENGRQLIVKINDRGPFVEGRVIDLSYAAARKLGFDREGTARVHVRALETKEGKILSSSSGRSPPARLRSGGEAGKSVAYRSRKQDPKLTPWPIGGGYLQVGAFLDFKKAQKLASRLGTVGTAKVWRKQVDKRVYYRVVLGPYAQESRSVQAMERLEEMGINSYRLVPL